MSTIKIDPQTTREIIKDITTSTLSAYQLGHKYKLSKMTIDRIGRYIFIVWKRIKIRQTMSD